MRVVKKNSLFQSLFGDSGTAYLYALANKRKKASSKKSAIHTFAERLSAMSGLTSVARGLKSMSASQDPDGRSVAPDRGGNGGRSVIIKANPRVVPVTEIRHAEST
eukprot:gene4736-5187_t